MNNKTKRLLLSLLILLVIWSGNFLINRFKGVEQPPVQPQTTVVQTSAVPVTTDGAGQSTAEQTAPNTTRGAPEKAESIDDLVALGFLEEITKDGKVVGWQSPAGIFYGMGSKHGNRLNHLFRHLEPDPDKPIHSVFDTDMAGLIELIDEAWQMRPAGELQSNGNRVYDVDMNRAIGTNGESRIRIVVRDGTEKLITAYPKK